MNDKRVLFGLMFAFGLSATACDKATEAVKGESASASDSASADDKEKKKKKKGKDGEKDGDAKSDGSATATGKPAVAAAPPAALAAAAPNAVAAAAFAHLPADCEVAMTMDLKKTMAHPAFAKEVAPLLEELASAPANDDDAKKFQAFMKETNTSPKSVQSFSLCVRNATKGDDAEFGFAIGGEFKPDSVVEAFAKHAKEITPTDLDGRKVLSDKDFTVGQFADGTVGMAKTVDLYKAMTGTNDNSIGLYKLDVGKEIAFAVSESLTAKAGADPNMEMFKGMKKASGSVDLAGGKLMLRLAMGDAEAATKANAMLILMKGQFEKKSTGNQFGEADILKSATSRIDGNDIIVEASFPQSTLEMGATMLAAELKKAKGKM